MKKGLLIVGIAIMIQACSPATADSTPPVHEDHHCHCKKAYELKKFPVKAGIAPGCPAKQDYILYQGFFKDADGDNAWCNKEVEACPEGCQH